MYCVIYKNSLLLNQHNGNDAPQSADDGLCKPKHAGATSVILKVLIIVEELETNLMSLVIFITLNICSTCFEH